MPKFTLFLLVLMSTLLNACGGGNSSGSIVPVTPTPSNTAPIVARANADQSAVVGTAFSYDATQGGTAFSDADNDSLTYTISYAPSANGLMDNDGVISGTPSLDILMTVTITANDSNGGSVSDELQITVAAAPTSSSKPNILLIISDDQGLDSSAQYSVSADIPTTPVLNGLAANGLVFDNVWVNPVCSPTRAGLLSGRYGVRTGVTSVGDSLPVSETILHEYLAADANTSEYASAMVGKWHLGGGVSGPNDAGITHFAGIIGGGVSDYYDWTLNVNGSNSNLTAYVTTELTDQAISWVGSQTEPWFLWLAYNAPHTPFHAPPAALHSQTLSGTDADITANPRDYYLAAIEAMDTEIGRLLGTLSDAERANTVILFVGDNGTPRSVSDTSAYPNGTKGSLTEGGVRVPMFVSGSGVTRQGEREAGLINNTDFYATIAQIAGSPAATINDSQSFQALLSGAAAAARDYSYTEVSTTSLEGWSIRDQRYKLIELQNGTQTLFDLQSDPMENTDLLTSGMDVSAILNDLSEAGDLIRQ